jgi:hypothetical protein
MSKWHIQEGFTLELSGEFLCLVYGDDESVRFHIDEIDDVLSALKRAKGYIEAGKVRQCEICNSLVQVQEWKNNNGLCGQCFRIESKFSFVLKSN